MPIGEAFFRNLPGEMQSRIRGTHWDTFSTESAGVILDAMMYLSKPNEKVKLDASVITV